MNNYDKTQKQSVLLLPGVQKHLDLLRPRLVQEVTETKPNRLRSRNKLLIRVKTKYFNLIRRTFLIIKMT